MIYKYWLHAAAAASASGNQSVVVGYLLLPLIAGSLSGAAFAYLLKRLGWPPNAVSVAPTSIMSGVLSYAILMIIDFTVSGVFTPFWAGTLIALFFSWPISLVLGPVLWIYIANLKKGRKILKDKTAFGLCALCLMADVGFIMLFDGSSYQ